MNRRDALAGLTAAAGGVLLATGETRAAKAKLDLPGAIAVTLGKAVTIGARSTAVRVNNTDLHIVSIGTGTFLLDKESRLTAKLNAAVAQYSKVEYWISVAVFDAKGTLLGVAGHKEQVQPVYLGRMVTRLPEFSLDFGISKAFAGVAFAVVAISERDVPKP